MEDVINNRVSISPKEYTGMDTYESEIGKMDEKSSMDEKWQALKKDYKNRSIIEGVVTAVVPNYKRRMVTVIADVCGVSIRITEKEYFSDKAFKKNFYTDTVNNQFRRKMQKAKASIHSRVRFVIIGMDEYINNDGMKVYVIYGSRLLAMEEIRKIWQEETHCLKPGDIIDASVYSVGEYHAMLEGFGMEFELGVGSITKQRRITNVAEELKVGDIIPVMIQKIYMNEDGTYYIRASAAVLETFKQKKDGKAPSGE